MNKKIIVTTSWDDGHRADVKLARLLKKYSLPGTFYISPFNHEFKKEERISEKALIEISRNFEIGAHTMTHQDLRRFTDNEGQNEISDSKNYLEDLLKKEITAFSYPYGYYNGRVKKLVKKAGFLTARSTDDFIMDSPGDIYSTGTSFEFCQQTLLGIYGQYKKVILNKRFSLLPSLTLSWYQNAKNLFDHVVSHGGIYHVWGHAYVVDKDNLWDKLESLFAHISNRDNVLYLTNSDVIKFYKNEKE